MDTLQHNADTITRFFHEIWTEGKLETADEICTPDFQFILAFAHLDGRDAYKTVPEDIVVSADKGAAFWNMSTTKHQDTWRNVPASGNPVAIKGLTFFRFNDAGQLTEARVQNDVMSMMKQINGIQMLYNS